MRIKHLLSFLLFFSLLNGAMAQRMLPAAPGLRERLVKYVADNHLPSAGMNIYWDSVAKKPVRFDAGSLMVEDETALPFVAPSHPSTNNFVTGGNFHLVKDINTATDAGAGARTSLSVYPTMAVLNNINYFAANDGVHGSELWRSDGTAAGTFMVKDITPGENSSAIYTITAAGSDVYFVLYIPNKGYELWKTNGTDAATLRVASLTSNAGYLCSVGNNLYFTLSAKNTSDQLWYSNGTAAGTRLVKDFSNENFPGNFPVRSLVSSNGLLFFIGATAADGLEVWRSNGTDTGTYMMKNVSPYKDGSVSPGQLTAYDNKLYFSELDSTNTNTLWVSDGTAAGTTHAVKNTINPVSVFNSNFISFFDNSPFVVSNGLLYFTGYSAIQNVGLELFTFNINNPFASPQLVKDVTPNGNTNLYPKQIADVNGTVYFTFQDSNGWHLYKTNGIDANTVDVKDMPDTKRIAWLTSAGNSLYFFAEDSVHGYEPWMSNGTAEGTVLLQDIYPGSGTSSPMYSTACNGKLFFSATDDVHGNDLWTSDGTTTDMIKDINTITTSGSNPYDFSFLGDKALFQAYTTATGYELWRSDNGSNAELVKDIYPGQSEGYDDYENQQIVKDGFLYFTGTYSYYSSSQGGGTIYGVYKSDGTANGTVKISQGTGRIEGFAVTDNNTVFYIMFNYDNFLYELWKTDGNANGAVRLRSGLDIDFSNSFYQTLLVAVGNSVYFSANDGSGTNGYELWKSDGTEAGTAMLKDINSTSPTASSNPTRLVSFNHQLFFSAYDGTEKAFWSSNGTESGTVKVKSVVPNPYSTSAYVISNGTLFFSGSTTDAGTELWKSDGTSSGTFIVRDIYTGTGSSSPANLIDVNGVLYFTAADNTTGNELWKSDGTTAGTQLVKDITAGAGSSSLFYFTAADGKLFFESNYKLWTSDGTASGTGEITDESLNNVMVYNIAGNGNQLYVAGYTYKYGIELYVGDASLTILPVTLTSFNASLKANDVIAQWQTMSEINTSYFNVQRSTDGLHFTDAGKLVAKGIGGTYTFNDMNIANLVSAKTIYYRLQIVDKDGSTSYSKVVPVNLNLKDVVVLLLPNPVKDVFRIRVNNYTGNANISVFDANGKNVYSTAKAVQSGNDFIINSSSLQSGVYIVKVNLNGKMIQKKFIKQ